MNESTKSAQAQNLKPEWFRLPSRGPDPHFGLTRPWYYAAEKRGDIRLVRIRERGKLRGITLVPYDAIAAFIRGQGRSADSGLGHNGQAPISNAAVSDGTRLALA